MDYYNINLFDEITQADLITKHEDKTLIDYGNIALYDDTVGKQGDIFFTLKSIHQNETSIIFDFGSSSIEVFEPSGIVVNKYIIGVKSARKIVWNWSAYKKLTYINDEYGLQTFSSNGNHTFAVSKKKPSFFFSTYEDTGNSGDVREAI